MIKSLLIRFISVSCVLILCACAPNSSAQDGVGLREFVSGVTQPTTITHAGDGSGRLFIAEKTGRLRVVQDGTLLPTPFLDLSDKVSTNSERGLLGVAFHPQYVSNGRFFVNYTDVGGDTVVAEFRVSSEPNIADASSERVLMKIGQHRPNHNGGQIAFGPDAYLYIGTGDGGGGGDPRNDSQNTLNLLGNILRIDVDTPPGVAYAIPADNPFVGNPAVLDEIWAYGLRNPWRFSFDSLTGDLWIADVGQNALEEINWQAANSVGGQNYGWRLMEGSACYNPQQNCNDGTLTLPVLEYRHGASTGKSVTGGYVYRGADIPALQARYLFGDFVSGRIWTGSREGERWVMRELLNSGLAISAFGIDEKNELYVADFGRGVIYRFVAE